MALGARIRALREKENLTQKALAAKLNIPHQNLSNYERLSQLAQFNYTKQH